MKKRSWVLFYGIYAALYVGMVFAVFHWFFANDVSFINMADAFRQHIKALAFYAKWLRGVIYHVVSEHSLDIQTFSMGMGYGTDIYPTLQYYAIGDILNIPALFVKNEYIYIYFQVAMMLRPFIAGITFSALCFYLRPKASKISVMAGMFTYAFCTFFMFLGIWHPFFANPLIYFPLVILGAEKILRENKSGFFAVAIFLAGSNNFFFFYMIVMLTIVYVVVRVAYMHGLQFKKWGELILKFMLSGIIGSLMAMVILLPVIMAFPANPRVNTGIRFSLFYSKEYYYQLIRNFFAFVYHGLYDTQVGTHGLILLPFILLLVKVVMSIFKKDKRNKEKNQLLTLLLVAGLFVCIPFFGYALTGFAYVINRWTFAFVLLSAFMLVDMWDDLFEMTPWEILICLICGGLFTFICYRTMNLDYPLVVAQLLVAAAGFIVITLTSLLSGKAKKLKKAAEVVVLALALLAIVVNGYYAYAPEQGNMIGEYYAEVDADSMHILLESTEVQAVEEAAENGGVDKNSFYRYSGRDMIWNASLIEGISSTQFYWSLANGVVSDYFKEMGNNDQQNFAYFALDDRAILNTLAGVRYYSLRFNTSEEWRFVPCLYEHCYDKFNFAIFENPLSLSLGYMYYNYIPRSEYEDIPTVNRQEALLYGAVIEDDKADYSVSMAEPEYSLVEMPIEISFEGDIEPSEGKWVAKAGSSIHIRYNGLPNTENYLWLDNFYVSDAATDYPLINVAAYYDGELFTSKDIWYKTEDNQFYSDWHDYFLNMGYAGVSVNEMVINITVDGIYTFDDIGIYCQPLENYVRQVSELRNDMLTDIELNKNPISYTTNRISGNVTAKDSGILCLTIPYSKGWTAYVDGEKTELLQTNTMFMGLKLSEGQHRIELKHHTPGLLAGFVLSIIGLVLLIVLVRREGKRND